MDELIEQIVASTAIQPFAARQKKKKRKGILLSLFSLVNRLVIMTMLVVLLRWWMERQNEGQLPGQTSGDDEISLDRYERSRGFEQPQTAPIQAPVPSGYEAAWPEPEASLSQAETAPIEELIEPENSGEMEIIESSNSVQAELAPAEADTGERELTQGQDTGAAPDDLRLIEGIGPKISSVLQSAGLRTFQQLADTEPGRLEEILQDSGLRLANPATWPEQARLLADGDLEGLRQLQAQLKGGRQS